MAIEHKRPNLVRRINLMADTVGGAEYLVSLDPDDMLNVAQRTTGLTEFGERLTGDDSWREAYYKMVECFDQQGDLNTLGRLMTRQEFIRFLRTRLMVVDAHLKNPSIREIAIEKPLFIVGNSRTGTTILHELLALDPHLRAPLAWETLHPVDLVDASVSRAELGECEQDIWADIVPEFAVVHEYSSYIPMECLTMMGLEFTSGMGMTGKLDDFMLWRAGTDPQPGYRMHRLFLQLLQSQQPTKNGQAYRWLLKSPVHLMTLTNLFTEYPDANIIHTHRDPVKTVASTISTVATTRYIRTDNPNPSVLAQNVVLGFQIGLEMIYQHRQDGTLPDQQIADLHYSDFMTNAVNSISDSYQQLNRPFTRDLEHAMQHYLDHKPQGKHGKHRYSPEDFGLSSNALREQFSTYMNAYGVKENV